MPSGVSEDIELIDFVAKIALEEDGDESSFINVGSLVVELDDE